MSDSLDWDDEDEGGPQVSFSEEEIEALRSAPVDVIICNHLYHMLQLATLHLSATPPHLAEAQLLIDGVTGLFESVASRLGQPQELIREALTQIQLAFVRAASGQAPID